MLVYIYNGEVNKLNDLAAELVVAADKYDIDHLELICEEKLLTHVSAENCIGLFKLSNVHSLKQLEKVVSFIKESRDKINESLFDELSKSSSFSVEMIQRFVF